MDLSISLKIANILKKANHKTAFYSVMICHDNETFVPPEEA